MKKLFLALSMLVISAPALAKISHEDMENHIDWTDPSDWSGPMYLGLRELKEGIKEYRSTQPAAQPKPAQSAAPVATRNVKKESAQPVVQANQPVVHNHYHNDREDYYHYYDKPTHQYAGPARPMTRGEMAFFAAFIATAVGVVFHQEIGEFARPLLERATSFISGYFDKAALPVITG